MVNNYQEGEQLAKQCLEANGFMVIDRTQEPEYWKKDIDFTAIKGIRKFNIEVKWDNRIATSGAMFLELLTNIQENKQGWANYTEADYIFYGDANKKLFYIFSVAEMRQYLKKNTGEYKTLVANDFNRRTGEIRKQSLGAIVPIGCFISSVETQILLQKEVLLNGKKNNQFYYSFISIRIRDNKGKSGVLRPSYQHLYQI